MKLIGFAVYLGIGAMLHAVFNGATFDWSSAWTFGWLFGWPIMLVITFGAAIVAFAWMATLIVAVWAWLKLIATWIQRRRRVAGCGDAATGD